MGRRWTQEEIDFIENNYGIKTNQYISKKLNRTESAIVCKATRLGLGRRASDQGFFTVTEFSHLIHLRPKTIKSWQKEGFKFKTKKTNKTTYKLISLNNFWEFVKDKRPNILWNLIPIGELGAEPDFMKGIREETKEVRNQYRRWTKGEKEEVRLMLNEGKTYEEIAKIKHRTVESIKNIIHKNYRQGITRIEFTKEEDKEILELYKKGLSPYTIGKMYCRTCCTIQRRLKKIKEGELKNEGEIA